MGKKSRKSASVPPKRSAPLACGQLGVRSPARNGTKRYMRPGWKFGWESPAA